MSDGRPIVLVLRAPGIGELLTAVPALRAIARAFPTHRRVLATAPALGGFAVHADLADEVIPRTRFGPLNRLGYRPAIAIDLEAFGPLSHNLLLDTQPARLIAFAHAQVPQSWHGPTWRADEHEVRRCCRLLNESGIVADSTQLDIVLPSRPIPAEAIGATILHPGAGCAARRWPVNRWAAVAAAEVATGRTVLLTGSAAERPLALTIARLAGLPRSAVWAGRTDLLALAAMVERAGRLVCGDTGVAHLATACRTPSVVLFGPSPPSRSAPPPSRPWHRALWYGRFGDPHGMRADPGLLRITVDDVVGALQCLPPALRPSDANGLRRRQSLARDRIARLAAANVAAVRGKH